MARFDENSLKKHLASKKCNNLYLLFGSEKYLVRHYCSVLLKSVAGEQPDEFAYHEFVRGEVDLTVLSTAVNTVAFMSKYNVVVVYDYDVNKLDKDDFNALLTIISDVPDTTVLIFAMPTLDTAAKGTDSEEKKGESSETSKGKRNKFKPFCTAVEKSGAVAEINMRDAVALEHQLASWADKSGKAISLAVASRLIYCCGTDLNILRNELNKLVAYSGEYEEITTEMIEAVTVKKLEVRIFDMVDYVIAGNFDKAYSAVINLFELKEDPRTVVRLIGLAYVDLYRARVTLESGAVIKDTADFFKYGNRAFVLNKARGKSEKLSTNAIRESMGVILDLNARLNTVAINEQAAVLKLIAELVLIAKRELSYA